MKLRFTFIISLILFLSLLCSVGIYAESGLFGRPTVPLKPESPLFGKDIVINDQPSQDQRNFSVCSAFNGWLYAVHSHYVGLQSYVTFLRSEDHGMTWAVLGDYTSFEAPYIIIDLDIIACGDSISNLKIFLAETTVDTNSSPKWGMEFVGRYKGEPFIAEQEILSDGGPVTSSHFHIALSSNQNYFINNVNPFNVSVTYTKPGLGYGDTLVYCSSSNGGMAFDNKRIVAISNSNSTLEKVALSFGRTFSKPEGRYFVAWGRETKLDSECWSYLYCPYRTLFQ